VRTITRSVLILGVLAGSSVAPPAAVAHPRPVLVLSAFPDEQAELLEAAMPVTEVGVFNGRRFFSGTIAGKPVVMGLTGIGLVNADRTVRAVLASYRDRVAGIVFSGVAGSPYAIGDVVVPETWTDGTATYPVDPDMFLVAQGLDGNVALDPRLPVEDVACIGLHSLRTPIAIERPLHIHTGGLGQSSDPYGGRAVPCLSSAGDLLGCEACGAPLNTSPGIQKFVSEAVPFADPGFFTGLFASFSSSSAGDAVVTDMETAAVARIAAEKGIRFLAFRGESDGGSDGGGDPLHLPGFPFQFLVYQQLAADNAAAATLEFLARWNP